MRVAGQNCRQVVVLGSTGSIGVSGLNVVEVLGDRLSLLGMTAHSRWEVAHAQVVKHAPRMVAITDPDAAKAFAKLPLPKETAFLHGSGAIEKLVRHPDADVVLSAIVGAAGLEGTWHALDAGKTVALANKETLVMAGPLVMELAARRGATILPVDSEHSALFQAMQSGRKNEIARVVLTASGGPFRGKSRRELREVTPEQALKHPTWQMGPKISVDSATMMNKALEIIEARWLFDLRADQIEVIIHPESIVHSFVEFTDGSVIAQLSPPDMRLPIQYALTYPDRVPGPTRKLAWKELSRFSFEQPDTDTFPSLELGTEVARRGGTCGAVLNAANEAAVELFLAGELAFLDIPRVCRAVLEHHPFSPRPTLSELHELDRWARQEVLRWNEMTVSPAP